MSLPADVQLAIDSELTKLIDNPAHDLTPTWRINLFAMIGPSTLTSYQAYVENIESKKIPQLTRADKIRARIAILTAQKVEALWETACKETDVENNEERDYEDSFIDHVNYLFKLRETPIEEYSVYDVPRPFIPQHILTMAELGLARIVKDEEKFLFETNEWWGIYGRPEKCPREYSIKWAAQEALYLAVLWIVFSESHTRDLSIDTNDLDLYANNHISAPAGHAMLAFAGIFDDVNQVVNKEKRRKFWLWWLTWAIPTAYLLESQTQTETRD